MIAGDTSESNPRNDPNNQDNDSEIIKKNLRELFGETIVQKFAEEEITYKEAIEDLLTKEADSAIYAKLGLNYGKAVRFRNEFSKLFPPKTPLATKNARNKPTMGKLESYTPDIKRHYLQKRKRVGTLAKAHWKNTYPKFHSPESKAELLQFAESIEEECAIPSIGFGKEGIMDHIREYFSEQRRYSKFKKSSTESSDAASSSGDTPPLPRMAMAAQGDESNSLGDVELEVGDDTDATMDTSTESQPLYSDDETNSEESMIPPTQVPSAKLSYNKTTCSIILKGVLGKIPDRGSLVKLLATKFQVKTSNLSALNYLEVMEITARKLVSSKYVKIKAGTKEALKNSDITVLKEIDTS